MRDVLLSMGGVSSEVESKHLGVVMLAGGDIGLDGEGAAQAAATTFSKLTCYIFDDTSTAS